MNKIYKFMNTPLGSFLKVFLLVVAAQFINAYQSGVDLLTMDWIMVKRLLITALISVIAPIVNAKNPLDTRYGKGKDEKKYTGKL
jgi:hypothetical protein